jgi:2,3-bisphosphoglycerate-independent phosphoglycerate mutase
MDRDKRWDRVRRAWDAIVDAQSRPSRADALALAPPTSAARPTSSSRRRCSPARADARRRRGGLHELPRRPRAPAAPRFVAAAFDGFVARRPALSRFTCLTEYDASCRRRSPSRPTTCATPSASCSPSRHDPTAHRRNREVRARDLLLQRRPRRPVRRRNAHPRAEPEGRHVRPAAGNELPEVTAKLVDAIDAQRFDVIVCNIANPDMVGHTGNLAAAIRAAEVVDEASARSKPPCAASVAPC